MLGENMPRDTSQREEGLQRIDYAAIRTTLSEVPTAIANRIDREKRAEVTALHPGLPAILRLTVRVAEVTWNSIVFLCGDADLAARRDEFSISVPPLARTILNSLFSIVFLFDQPTQNTRHYFASGWRELEALQGRLTARYGSDPGWSDWLKAHGQQVAGFEADAAITTAEKAAPAGIKWWPNPGKMPAAIKDTERRAFLEHMNDWYYRNLSGDSHLSFPGLLRRGGHLSDMGDANQRVKTLWRYRSQVVLTGLTVFMAFLSEVVGQLQLEHEGQRLSAAWGHLGKWPEADDLHRIRYKKWLPS